MKKRIFCLLLSLLLVMGSVFTLETEYRGDVDKEENRIAQVELTEEEIIQVETVSFEYPITPDDPEWKELGSVRNKIEACRIPTEILDKMTDEQLIQAILDFPFLIDLFLVNSKEDGVKSLERTCDAYRELLSRSSAKDALLNKVEQQASVCSTEISVEEEFINNALGVLILYQEDFVGKLTVNEVNAIADLLD